MKRGQKSFHKFRPAEVNLLLGGGISMNKRQGRENKTMFFFTFNKNGLHRAGTVALCAVCLAGTLGLVSHFSGQNVAAQAGTERTINSTQDIAGYFADHGFEIDVASATVDEVKIPKDWDDSFLAFNTVVGESGSTLEKYKGKTVEKWVALCPGMSSGDEKTNCVLLVYKKSPIGAYLLEQPSGEVTGLTTGAAEQAQQTAAQQFGEEALETSADEDMSGDDAMTPDTDPPTVSEDVPQLDDGVIVPEAQSAAQTSAWPVE